MTTIKNLLKRAKRIKFIIIPFAVLVSCVASKKDSSSENSKPKADCYITKAKSFSLPSKVNESTKSIVNSFSNSTYELQLLNVKVIQGYDYKEDSRIIYLENESFFEKDNAGLKKIESIDLITMRAKLAQIEKGNFITYCKDNSSRKETNQFYLKQGDDITFSFVVTGKELIEVNEDLSQNEISFIKLFFKD